MREVLWKRLNESIEAMPKPTMSIDEPINLEKNVWLMSQWKPYTCVYIILSKHATMTDWLTKVNGDEDLVFAILHTQTYLYDVTFVIPFVSFFSSDKHHSFVILTFRRVFCWLASIVAVRAASKAVVLTVYCTKWSRRSWGWKVDLLFEKSNS